jgi:DNA helicase-2/ATP-dependent DNA helicase PcrA
MAEDRWTDDVALYRPQRDEVRRDLYDMLERWFASEVSGDVPDVLAVERSFGIQVGGHAVKGTIDRIDRVAGGLAIVDYKTGRKMAKAEDVAEDLQLAIYHLAAVKDPELAALGPPVRLVLRYVRSGEDREQPITEGHAQHTEERILAAAERIVEEAFDPVVGADCDHCAFHRLCPLQAEGREVGAP